jgi:hypothetical protein
MSWEKNPWYPLNRRLGRPQNWSGYFGYEITLLPTLGFEPQIIQPSHYTDYTILAPEGRTNM